VRPNGRLGHPDGQLFQCLKSNSEKFSNFGKAVRTLDVSVLTVALLEDSIGRPDHQIASFFVSFPMTSISSQSDIGPKSYDQNTRGYPDGLTKRPNGQLQPPFQTSAESFHNRTSSGRCFPVIRMVSLQLHVITIIRL
jgi:hypothetical protein